MFFTYWDGNPAELIDFQNDWIDCSLRTYGDNEVLAAAMTFPEFPDLAELYKKISLPTCKSDLARLILLYKFGGFYIDCHAGKENTIELLKIFCYLCNTEVVTFTEGDDHIKNGAILSRSRSEVILLILRDVYENLVQQYKLEKESCGLYIPYNIAFISGAVPIRGVIYKSLNGNLEIKNEMIGRVTVVDLKKAANGCEPFKFYKHCRYRAPGEHWSERQHKQPLFL